MTISRYVQLIALYSMLPLASHGMVRMRPMGILRAVVRPMSLLPRRALTTPAVLAHKYDADLKPFINLIAKIKVTGQLKNFSHVAKTSTGKACELIFLASLNKVPLQPVIEEIMQDFLLIDPAVINSIIAHDVKAGEVIIEYALKKGGKHFEVIRKLAAEGHTGSRYIADYALKNFTKTPSSIIIALGKNFGPEFMRLTRSNLTLVDKKLLEYMLYYFQKSKYGIYLTQREQNYFFEKLGLPKDTHFPSTN